jgi:hypothetical protein
MQFEHSVQYLIKVVLTETYERDQYVKHRMIMESLLNVFGDDINIEYYGIRQWSKPTFVFVLNNYNKHKNHIMFWYNEIKCITYPELIYGTDSVKICLI